MITVIWHTIVLCGSRMRLDNFGAMSGSEWLVRRCFSEDGLHPTGAGYAVMSSIAQTVLDQAL